MQLSQRLILNLKGGFGNQLYQLNAAYSLSKKIKGRLFITAGSFCTDYYQRLPDSLQLIYSIKGFEANVLKTNFNPAIKILRLISAVFKSDALKVGNLFCRISTLKKILSPEYCCVHNILLDGYFQDVPIDPLFKASLLSSLTSHVKTTDRINDHVLALRGKKSILLHIRGNDYLESTYIRKHYGLLAPDYYKKAANEIARLRSIHLSEFDIYITSDDIDYAESIVSSVFPRFSIIKEGHIESFYLLTQSANLVLSNSSYSCIAAHLSQYPNACICYPKRWFDDPSVISPTPSRCWHAIHNSYSS